MAQESYQCSECSGAFDVDWGGCGYRNQCAAWQGDLVLQLDFIVLVGRGLFVGSG